MKKYLLLILILTCSLTASAESLTLETQKEKETAISINAASDRLSEKVMDCIESNGGEMEGCTCETREACPFKADFDNFINSYCSAVTIFPNWKKEMLYWQIEGDINGYNLATKHLEHHFGKHCK